MSAEVSIPADQVRKTPKGGAGLVALAPDSDVPETRPKLSAAKGLMIAGGAAAVFWAAVAAAVIAVRN
jgi:hypothetical protein